MREALTELYREVISELGLEVNVLRGSIEERLVTIAETPPAQMLQRFSPVFFVWPLHMRELTWIRE
jgi:hypothetical protein